ncbi:hypothetical protein LTR85_007928 [Meristemomyces frigidus]|nr:hypothetical protein LTR85_007928 [Meristemomyces frigidus]
MSAHQQQPEAHGALGKEFEKQQAEQAPPPQPILYFRLCGSMESLRVIRPREWFPHRLQAHKSGGVSMEEYVLCRLAMNVRTTIATFHLHDEGCAIQRPFSDLYECFKMEELVGKAVCLHTCQQRKRHAPQEEDVVAVNDKKSKMAVDDYAGVEPSPAASAPEVQAEGGRDGTASASVVPTAMQQEARNERKGSLRKRNAPKIGEDTVEHQAKSGCMASLRECGAWRKEDEQTEGCSLSTVPS